MTRPTIKIRKESLEQSRILARKDFNRLKSRYHRYKWMQRASYIFITGGSMLLILAAVWTFMHITPEANKSTDQNIPALVMPADSAEGLLVPVPVLSSPEDTQEKPSDSATSSVPGVQTDEKAAQRKTGKGKKEAVVPDEIPAPDKKILRLHQFLQTFTPPVQHFTVSPGKDTTVQAAQGTVIRIPAGSFSYADGSPVREMVQVAVQEFYNLPDMIVGNLTTSSEGALLETGGMINLEAKSDKGAVGIGQGKSIELRFPTQNKQTGMQLFMGRKASEEDPIDWLPELPVAEDSEVFQVVEYAPSFMGGMEEAYRYINKNLRYPDRARRAGVQGRVFVEFIVEADGSISNVQIVRGIGYGCDEEVLRVFRSMPSWIPGRQRAKPVRVRMAMPVMFKLDGLPYNPDNVLSDSSRVEDTTVDFTPEMGNAVNDEGRFYTLRSNRLGWINCDRFVEYTGPRITVKTNAKSGEQARIVLIFKKYRSLMAATRRTGSVFVFENIPAGEEVVILGIKYTNQIPHIATQTVKVSKTMDQPTLNFEPCTKREFRQQLKDILQRTVGW